MTKNLILHLSLIDGIGDVTIQHLLSFGDDFNNLYQLSSVQLQRQFGLSVKKAELIAVGLANKQPLEQELEFLERNKISTICLCDPSYPYLLTNIHVPPVILYCKGYLENTEQTIALVGARKANYYAKNVIKKIVPALVEAGFTIVSGGAVGIDTFVHQEVLQAGGRTVAVLGSGLLNPYPAENKKLFEEIVAKGGAVISAFPLLMEPLAGNFPARNRIISGLSRGTVVVQAAEKSGALITAQHAVEQNRDVFAVPGPIDEPLSYGCHMLIQQGAKLVTQAQDILQEYVTFFPFAKQAEKTPLLREQLPETDPVVQYCAQPRSFDELLQLTSLEQAALQIKLFDLQIEGKVEQNFAGLWQVL